MFSADPKPANPIQLNPVRRDSAVRVEPSAAAEPISSVIGNDLTLLGENITIISKKKLHVSGDVRGNVHGKQVIITESGSVRGTVSAEGIEVKGKVHGSIRAVNVALRSTAVVDGDIVQNSLAIAEGARFDGRVIRANETAELMPVLDPEAIAGGRA
jgi:cytoskeletal protein CcmA (bactofilin family)